MLNSNIVTANIYMCVGVIFLLIEGLVHQLLSFLFELRLGS